MQDEITAAIAADLGISHMPAEEQKTLIAQFGEVALKAATLAVVDKLSEEKRGEFMKLVEGGDTKVVQAFLDREVPGHEEVAKAAVTEEVRRFKEFQSKDTDKGAAEGTGGANVS